VSSRRPPGHAPLPSTPLFRSLRMGGVAPAGALGLVRGPQRHLVVGHLRSGAGFTTRLSRSRAVVARGADSPVHYDHGTDPPPHAIGTCGDGDGNAEDVLIPRRAVDRAHLCTSRSLLLRAWAFSSTRHAIRIHT